MKNLLYLFIAIGLLSGCKDDPDSIDDQPVDNIPTNVDTLVEVNTDHGSMIMYMYKGTPLHRANFHKLVGEGFYNGTEFHRIIPNFMIQGGDPNSKDDNRANDGQGGPGYTIPAEIDTNKYMHDSGAVAAARIGDTQNPERRSSGSQFYIVVSEPGTKHLNGAYTVFGKVIQGLETAQTIVTQRRQSSNNLPITRIPMTMKFIIKTPEDIFTEYGFQVED